MKKSLFLLLIFLSVHVFAQTDSTKWVRAFPITSYIVDLNDSTKVVQVNLQNDKLISKDQVGVLRGTHVNAHADTVTKGFGRCHLIKGEYYYFAIKLKDKSTTPKEGDLLYTFVDKKNIHYGRIPKIAAHFIQLTDVYEKPFYDPYAVLEEWTAAREEALVDSMVKDIKLTGDYFSKNNPEMNKEINSGDFKGKKILSLMVDCEATYVKDFMDYVVVRPYLYAGRVWKVSEVFATWASEGAPTIVK